MTELSVLRKETMRSANSLLVLSLRYKLTVSLFWLNLAVCQRTFVMSWLLMKYVCCESVNEGNEVMVLVSLTERQEDYE